jgi:hypothetical protein
LLQDLRMDEEEERIEDARLPHAQRISAPVRRSPARPRRMGGKPSRDDRYKPASKLSLWPNCCQNFGTGRACSRGP